jgi:hypothetical protein
MAPMKVTARSAAARSIAPWSWGETVLGHDGLECLWEGEIGPEKAGSKCSSAEGTQ